MDSRLHLGRVMVVCAALVSGAAQPPADPPQVLSVETNLVVLPVTTVQRYLDGRLWVDCDSATTSLTRNRTTSISAGPWKPWSYAPKRPGA